MWDVLHVYIFYVLNLVVGMVHGLSFPVNLEHLSAVQKSDISVLRELVKHGLTEDYMVDDVYLAKWLHETNFSVPSAQKLIQQNLEWRSKEKINSILTEDWKDMHARFPYTRETKDKSGKPILYINLYEWDIAKFFLEENSAAEKLSRYAIKLFEDSEDAVRQLRAQGEHVTQFNLIISVGEWSLMQHTCFQCNNFYRSLGKLLTPHFPYATERIVLVNAPFLFMASYDDLVEENKHNISMYGQAQNEWEPELLKFIDRDQIPAGLLDMDKFDLFMDPFKVEL